MIDLHVHSTYSDGTDNLISLLKLAEKNKLEVISITDHNTCDVYQELKNINVKDYYSGEIITGIELNTHVSGIPIEILVYNFKYDEFNLLLKELVPIKEQRFKNELKILYDACINNNILVNKELIDDYDALDFPVTYFLKYVKENNIDIKVSKDIIDNPSLFYRKYVSDKNSIFYCNPSVNFMNLKEVIKKLRKQDLKIFIAHAFEYKNNYETVIQESLKEDIDGFECYHSSFTEEQISYLLDLCHKNNLLISGGTDYHGDNKPGINLKVGKGNLNIPKDIIKKWR